jgi:hypothetical protein
MNVFKNAQVVLDLCKQYGLDEDLVYFYTISTDILEDTLYGYPLEDVKYLTKEQISLGKFCILIGKENVKTLTLKGNSADIRHDFELEFMRLCFG